MGWGALVTVELTVFGCFLALIVAFVAGLGRVSSIPVLRWVSSIYVEIFRGTSALVQLFWFFYALPLFGIRMDAITTGILVLGLNVGSYGAEVVRGAILSVPKEQIESAIALNFTPWTRMRKVILPQAIVTMLPPFGNLAIDLMKGTALCSLITIADLTFQAQVFRSQTGNTALPFIGALLTYFVIASIIAFAMRKIENHMTRGLDMTKRN